MQFWSPSALFDSNIKSSAYSKQLIYLSVSLTGSQEASKYVGISLTKILNNVGFKLPPCLTPAEDENVSVQ